MDGSSPDLSFNTVVLPHLAAAAHLARWLTRDADAADDLLQDALVRALTYFSSFRGVNARHWLLRIVRNTVYTSTSRNRRIELVPIESRHERRITPHDDPETHLIKTLDLQSAIASLSTDLRETLMLREFEGLSYKEIATVTEIPIGTVMSRLWCARQMLLRMLFHEDGAKCT